MLSIESPSPRPLSEFVERNHNTARHDDAVDVLYRFRWLPIALMGLVSLGPFFGWQ